MTKTLVERADELGDFFEEQAEEADRLGRLPDNTVKVLKDLGIVRALQPKDFGGDELSPVDFFETVLSIGARSGAAGWVSSVVGVHPFELAQGSRQMQEEIWGKDPDTWVASPYAPFGRGVPVEGGYRFTGRWPFSSGTDACDWIVLGGMIADEDGNVEGPTALRHFVLPRSDYEILQDSWDVVGLRGSGSKDVVINGAFVPEHRVIDTRELSDGSGPAKGREDSPLYRMSFHTMFSGAITTATLALAEGALGEAVAYMRRRKTSRANVVYRDPHQLSVLGAAAADIASSRLQLLHDIDRMWKLAQAGKPASFELRAEVRRNQVRLVHRAAAAVDEVVQRAGGAAMRLDNPIQRFWRDLHTGLGHGAHAADPIYQAYGASLFGDPIPPGVKI